MAKTKQCLVCNSRFEYCPHCSGNPTPWKTTYCSEECRDIFNTCYNFESKYITQEEAYNRLNELNIKDKNIQKSVKGSVEKIMAFKKLEQPKVTKELKPVEETVTEEKPVQKRMRRRRPRNIEE